MNSVYRSETGRDLVQARYRELLERWPAGTRQLRVPTREGETFVVNCGPADAPPVVMLQGSGANAAMWLPDISDVRSAAAPLCRRCDRRARRQRARAAAAGLSGIHRMATCSTD
jgi:hypothetical protein